ncbi:MAG: iron-containing alcohol dehydrogenase family protein [Sarcina sp.]
MYKYYMPTKVFFGRGIVNEKSEELKIGKIALIVTGRYSSKANGSLNDVTLALKKENIEYIVFDEVEENPSVETVCKASEIGKKKNVDFVIGIGGGSPIDAAKAIAVMIKNSSLTSETIFSGEKLEAIPVVAVPTTAGTGTETTQYSILTDNKAKTKKNLGQEIFPVVSLVDASYMLDMNMKVTINTAVDAMSHIVEGYLNTNANIISDSIAQSALKIWGKSLNGLLKGELTFEDRENLMVASSLAGIVIAQTGTSLPHGMGYALTYFKGVPHGLANGCLYKEYLKIFKNREKVNEIYSLLGLNSEDELYDVLDKLTGINIEITKEELKVWSEEFASNIAKLKNHPEIVSKEEIFEIYAKSLLK